MCAESDFNAGFTDDIQRVLPLDPPYPLTVE
jgi:hypothetical protein